MATLRKTVRFFDTTLVDENENRSFAPGDFWSTVLARLGQWTLADRTYKVGEVVYFGRALSPRRPALPHLQIERIRDLSEQLNVSNLTSGDVEPLELDSPDERVSEPTYLVPFGQGSRVAVMSPAVQATRPETLGRWITGVLDLVPQGRSLELTPVVDPRVLEKIQSSDGAVMLEVHVDAGAPIPATGGGVVGDAFRNAQHQALHDARLTLRWALDASGGNETIRDAIKQGALWVARGGFSSRAQVKIVDRGEDGSLERELHSIFDDRITEQVMIETLAGERAAEEDILAAIGQAILRFGQRD